MKYVLDTEFSEYKKKPYFGKPIDTIELISIGIVSEDKREYYAVCKEFDIKAAWNKWQPREESGYGKNADPKEYWLRENVLNPIFLELRNKHNVALIKQTAMMGYGGKIDKTEFTYSNLKFLILKYGQSRKQIAQEIKEFVYKGTRGSWSIKDYKRTDIEFYGYYAAYDFVVFCWLFGGLMNLPKGFPTYCRDLKQMLDEKAVELSTDRGIRYIDLEQHAHYPKNVDQHHSLYDAAWGWDLYEFITQL